MSRIFIAINLPENIKEGLAKISQEISQSLPMEAGHLSKWVEKNNWHITLLFLGEVKPERLAEVSQIVRESFLGWQAFDLQISKVCFDNQKTPRLIWARLEPSDDLTCLNQILKDKLAKANILQQVDKRQFNSHITLARLNSWQWQRIEPEEQPVIDYDLSLIFKAESIEVMKSHLQKTGSQYKVIESIKLL